jgi:hypothetical protein
MPVSASMVRSPRLKPGDLVRVVALLGECRRRLRSGAVSLGLPPRIAYGEDLFQRRGYLAGEDDERAALLNRLLGLLVRLRFDWAHSGRDRERRY